MAVTAFLAVAVFLLLLASVIAGAWLGVRLARSVRWAPRVPAPTGAFYEFTYRVALLAFRVMVFNTVIVVVSAPVIVLAIALLALA